jgi:ferredoxin
MEHKYIKNVSTLKLDSEKCIGCGMCADICPHRILVMDSSKVTIRDKDLCMGCGACAKNCPTSAISVVVGVGCAIAILNGLFRKTSPNCDSGSLLKGGKGCC